MKRLVAFLFVVPLFFTEAQIFERVTNESNPIVTIRSLLIISSKRLLALCRKAPRPLAWIIHENKTQ